MKIDRLRKQFCEISNSHHDTPSDEYCAKLFALFVEAEDSLDRRAETETGLDISPCAEQLLDLQSEILKFAATIECRLIKEVLFKLAIWRRWSSSEIEPPMSDMQLSDALAYSAYIDLVDILGERSLMTESDLAHVNATTVQTLSKLPARRRFDG